jgi:pyruvate/oxaloacetate carboxyltransferase
MFLPVHVTDTTLRDGVENFVLKELHQEDLNRLGKLLDRVGFYSIDCWGGSTFYTALTELQEDPWERLKRLRRAIRTTPLQMVVRGQMLVGFKPYHKEVVRKFLAKAAGLGIDIFRIYDQLNDLENMRLAIAMAKELRKQVEATVLFSLNPSVTQVDYLRLAEDMINLGADAICINDSLGIMTPEQVASLVTTYRWNFHQPLRLHLHDNHKKAIEAYLVGIRAGVERVDTLLAPLAWAEGPPAVESLIASLGDTLYDLQIDLEALDSIADYIQTLKETHRYQELPQRKAEDSSAEGYIPELLKEYLREELRSRNARDRQQVAFKEAHRVWSDLGFLPMKGRILEIIGGQAMANVFSSQRYENLTEDMKDLIKGRYGPLYSIANEALRRLALEAREEERGQSWDGRLRQPPGITLEEDILTYSLFPDEAAHYFHVRTEKQAAPTTPKPAAPAAAPQPAARLAPAIPRGLSLTLKGEEVGARLEAIGPLRGNKQTLFVNIADMTEEIEVTLLSSSGAMPEYLIAMHGETYLLRFKKVFPKEEEYTPIFLDIDDKVEEFLIKHLHID